jgi:hypothetical protein
MFVGALAFAIPPRYPRSVPTKDFSNKTAVRMVHARAAL